MACFEFSCTDSELGITTRRRSFHGINMGISSSNKSMSIQRLAANMLITTRSWNFQGTN